MMNFAQHCSVPAQPTKMAAQIPTVADTVMGDGGPPSILNALVEQPREQQATVPQAVAFSAGGEDCERAARSVVSRSNVNVDRGSILSKYMYLGSYCTFGSN